MESYMNRFVLALIAVVFFGISTAEAGCGGLRARMQSRREARSANSCGAATASCASAAMTPDCASASSVTVLASPPPTIVFQGQLYQLAPKDREIKK
jgi:hypothetical protein